VDEAALEGKAYDHPRPRCQQCRKARNAQARELSAYRRRRKACVTCGRPAKRRGAELWRYCPRHLEYYAARQRADK